jgi:glycerol kinase
VLDPYFSATKIGWLFGAGGVDAGPDTAVGTVDSWLLWKLTGGRRHVTDVTNASRTLLFDIAKLRWDRDLADLFGVPTHVLAEIAPTSGRIGLAARDAVPERLVGVPISGVAGDQQAALFGQGCFTPGMIKNTYGTGSFVLMNVGPHKPDPVDGMLSTVAWALDGTGPADTTYALEGSIFVTGAAVQWLRDGLGMIREAAEIGPLAESVADSGGAVFVPALTGLGSPWWDPRARGTVVGLSRGVGRAHLARAVVEAMAFQTKDVVDAMCSAAGRHPAELRVDGGASTMDLLLQIQADLLGAPVVRAAVSETTALGAAFLAGRAEGVWASLEEVGRAWAGAGRAEPVADRTTAYQAWRRAVERSRDWEREPA